jgi:hypothetical protein
MRKRLAPIVASGTVRCARCGGLIEPGDRSHLDHRDDGHAWLGPSHAKCNQRAGWERMVDVASGNAQRERLDEQPYIWSQRWFDDPPVGTQVVLGGGMAEVYLGGGQWSEPVPVDRGREDSRASGNREQRVGRQSPGTPGRVGLPETTRCSQSG